MNKTPIKIICFAGLRKYFGSELTVLVETGASYSQVINELKVINPEATEILSSCRIAVNEDFISLEELLEPENILFLIPPSSGG